MDNIKVTIGQKNNIVLAQNNTRRNLVSKAATSHLVTSPPVTSSPTIPPHVTSSPTIPPPVTSPTINPELKKIDKKLEDRVNALQQKQKLDNCDSDTKKNDEELVAKMMQDLEQLEITRISKNLYIGPYQNLFFFTNKFKNINCDFIINCCEEYTHACNDTANIKNYPIIDGDQFSMMRYMDKIVDIIKNNVKNKKVTYLHCTTGDSRAATIFIYYLMMYKKTCFDDALKIITNVRATVDIHTEFENLLRQIEDQ